MLVNVVCLKWGTKYDAEYVNRLYSMVERNLTIPHRFVCVTDDPRGLDPAIERRPIEHSELTGWWHKLTLFKPRFYDLEGATLFLDLDIVIMGSLDGFFQHEGEFCIISSWKPNYYNSAVFRLNIGAYPEVWEAFEKRHQEVAERLHGDQDWMTEMIPDAAGWPDGWVVSYKKHCVPLGAVAGVPRDARIVAFHGSPRQHEIKDGPLDEWEQAPWINDYWR